MSLKVLSKELDGFVLKLDRLVELVHPFRAIIKHLLLFVARIGVFLILAR